MREERIDDLSLDMIYEIQKEYINTEIINEGKLLRLSINKEDDSSKLNLNNLKSRTSEYEYSKIERVSSVSKNISEMIRWSCRGLGTYLSIEKFLINTIVDEVNKRNIILYKEFCDRLDREYYK